MVWANGSVGKMLIPELPRKKRVRDRRMPRNSGTTQLVSQNGPLQGDSVANKEGED